MKTRSFVPVKLITALLIETQLLGPVPFSSWAASAALPRPGAAEQAAAPVIVHQPIGGGTAAPENPRVELSAPSWLSDATAAKIHFSRIFAEPLIPIGQTTKNENSELAAALDRFLGERNAHS